MSIFDFSSLNRPPSGGRPTKPIEIFRSAPALSGAVNDLWQGQSKALELWDKERTASDVLISLHTGAGKTLVGLLVAQSLVNEGTERVLYVCATNDLVLQTSREITNKLGFDHSTRSVGRFSNDLYATGRGFCITNYQALFNGRSIFRGDLKPSAILFDDAHVSEKIIRDCYTVKLDRDENEDLYREIIVLLAPHFAAVHRDDYFKGIVSGTSSHKATLVPPSALISLVNDNDLAGILRRHNIEESEAGFAFEHLADHLRVCTMYVSKSSIEICPAFLPTKRIPFLADKDIRRVYLSATLTSEVDFCRAFGRRPSVKVEPESDAGMGERLIVLADRETLMEGTSVGVADEKIAAVIARDHKVLISTSSYISATKYKSISTPPKAVNFSAALDSFRSSTAPGAFILVGRVDGIDLPHATCRVMIADSLPLGVSLYETFLYEFLEMRNSFAAKMANRITQLFGRTNRGRNDYSVIFVTDKRLKSWLSAPRNLALLPELLRKQVRLGQSLVQQFKINDVSMLSPLAGQVLARDANWLAYYGEWILAPDVDAAVRAQTAENDAVLVAAALKEADFAAAMWDHNTAVAREALGGAVDSVVVADRRLAAWYNINIGQTLELEGDGESAAKQYSEAKSRSTHVLPLPLPATTQSLTRNQEPRNGMHAKLLSIFSNDVRVQNDWFVKFRRSIEPAFESSATSNQHEEAIRALGELLGFDATRPEQEADTPSTLDVLWTSSQSNEAILLELKTKKKTSDSVINMEDVGQALQQITWVERETNSKILGHVIICDAVRRSRESAPAPNMHVASMVQFKALFDEYMQQLLALQRMSGLERFAEINSVVARAEWQPKAIFARISGSRVADCPAS